MNHRINVNDLPFSDALERSHADRGHRCRREHGRNAFVDRHRRGHLRAKLDEPLGARHRRRRGRRRDERLLRRQRRSAGDLGSVTGSRTGRARMAGTLIDEKQVTLKADLHGRLVNQPPTRGRWSTISPPARQTVECSLTGGGTFTLDGSESTTRTTTSCRSGGSRAAAPARSSGRCPGRRSRSWSARRRRTTRPRTCSRSSTRSVSTTRTRPGQRRRHDRAARHGAGHGHGRVHGAERPRRWTWGPRRERRLRCRRRSSRTMRRLLFNLGNTTVTWTAIDESKNKGTATQTVKIVDTTPPKLDRHAVADRTLAAEPQARADHRVDHGQSTSAIRTRPCGWSRSRATSPTTAWATATRPDDIQVATLGADARTFLLRSERSGNGNGRVYTVTYQATDASGNATTKTVTVVVPKNQARQQVDRATRGTGSGPHSRPRAGSCLPWPEALR